MLRRRSRDCCEWDTRAGRQSSADSTHRDSVLCVAPDLRQELPCGGVQLRAASAKKRQHGPVEVSGYVLPPVSLDVAVAGDKKNFPWHFLNPGERERDSDSESLRLGLGERDFKVIRKLC